MVNKCTLPGPGGLWGLTRSPGLQSAGSSCGGGFHSSTTPYGVSSSGALQFLQVPAMRPDLWTLGRTPQSNKQHL